LPERVQAVGIAWGEAVSVIAAYDLLYAVESIFSRTFETIPLLLVATIWYLIIVSVLMLIQNRVEARCAKGSTRNTDEKAGMFARLTTLRATTGETT
jgi:polar amino acid transport system permease protein